MTTARLSLWGRVVDGGGTPLPGAELFWVDEEHARGDGADLLHVHKVGQSDAEGRFWASGLPAGPGVLVPDFHRIGIGTERVRLDRGTRLTLPMAEGADDVLLRFPVTPQDFARILGTCYDSVDQQPVAGHLLVLTDPVDGTKFKREVLTGPDGSFAFPFLPPGKFLLGVMGSGRHLFGVMPVEVVAGKKVEARIGLHRRPPGPTHSVRMRVEGPLGLPVPGARAVLRAENYLSPPLDCGPDGWAEGEGYAVRPTVALGMAPGYWTAAAGVPPAEPGVTVEVTVRLGPSARLRVTARDASTNAILRYANFHVSGGGADFWTWGGILPPPDAPVKEFEEFTLPPGPVTIHADSPGFRETTRVVEVPDDDEPTAVEVRLEPRRT